MSDQKNNDGPNREAFEEKASKAKSNALVAFITVFGVVFGAILGFTTDMFKTSSERAVSEMKIAIEVLKLPNNSPGQKGFRKWACMTLDVHSKAILDCEKVKNIVLPSSFQIGQVRRGDPGKADVDVFICEENPEFRKLAEKISDGIYNSGFFGRVRLKKWQSVKEYSISDLKGYINFIVDKGHDEVYELPKIQKIIREIDSSKKVRVLSNKGKRSGWYIAVVICN